MTDRYDRKDIREKTDNIIDKLDERTLENIAMEMEINKYVSEVEANLHKIKTHGYYPSTKDIVEVERITRTKSIQEDDRNRTIGDVGNNKTEVKHGDDCHCSRCCPQPNPNFFQKHKFEILMGVLWTAIIILAVGWSPSGATFEAMQESYLDLIVNFFKMGVFFIAGIASYHLMKKKKDEE